MMSKIPKLAALLFLCSSPLLAAPQDLKIDSLEIALSESLVQTEFVLFRWSREQCIYRSVTSTTMLEFSDFKTCKIDADEEEFISDFLRFVKDPSEIVGDPATRSGITLTAKINYSTDHMKSFQKIRFQDVYPSFLIPDQWETEDQDTIAEQISALGVRNYQLLTKVLNYKNAESDIWSPEKCLLNIRRLKPGVFKNTGWKGNVWDLNIEFDKQIEPVNFSCIINYHPNMSSAPYGMINLGRYYGAYELTMHSSAGSKKEPADKKDE